MLSESPKKLGLSQELLLASTPVKALAAEAPALDFLVLDYHLHQCIQLRLQSHESPSALREAFELSSIITSKARLSGRGVNL